MELLGGGVCADADFTATINNVNVACVISVKAKIASSV
jgi:hypothetical protein